MFSFVALLFIFSNLFAFQFPKNGIVTYEIQVTMNGVKEFKKWENVYFNLNEYATDYFFEPEMKTPSRRFIVKLHPTLTHIDVDFKTKKAKIENISNSQGAPFLQDETYMVPSAKNRTNRRRDGTLKIVGVEANCYKNLTVRSCYYLGVKLLEEISDQSGKVQQRKVAIDLVLEKDLPTDIFEAPKGF